MTETQLLFAIRKALASADQPMWRNNVGFDRERKVHYGLGNGSPDLVGICRRPITLADVGTTVGVFFGVEVKTPIGRVSADQRLWHTAALGAGAVVAVVRSPQDALAALTLARGE